MGKGGNVAASGDRDRVISWEEVHKHNGPDNKWIVVNGDVYDITRWSSRHPGGSRVISHYAGQDASEAFFAFHIDLKHVNKYLGSLRLGSIEEHQTPNVKDDELKADFEQLHQTVKKMGCFKPSITFYSAVMLHIILLEVLCFLILYNFGSSWLPWIASCVCMATLQAQAGWAQHDFGHLSFFRTTFMNHVIHRYLMNITKGASGDWWNHMHNQHHSKPNVIGKDPDVRLEALFVIGEEMPKKVAKSKKGGMPYNWQQHYFFLTLPPFLFPLYFQYMTFRNPIVRREWLDLVLVLIFYVKLAYVFYPLFPSFLSFFMWCFLWRVLESHWFTWVSQSNHIPMEVDEDKGRPWLSLQIHATCDIEKSYFNDWFTGHLNFQVEHHLFPTMPRHNLYKIQPLVRSLCLKHGLKYEVKPLLTAFGDIIRSLKRSGDLWKHYYDSYHINHTPNSNTDINTDINTDVNNDTQKPC